MDTSQEQLAQEELRHNELLFNQSRQQENQSIQQALRELKKVKEPSRFAYFILISTSALSDILDIVEALFLLFTGTSSGLVSIPLAIFVSIVFIIVGYIENGKLQKRAKASAVLLEKIDHIDQRIRSYRKMYTTALRVGRKIKPLRKPLRQFALGMKKFTSKNKILSKVIRNSIFQVIPFLDLWPWQTIATWQTYKARKQAYLEAQEEMRILYQAQKEQDIAFQESQILQRELLQQTPPIDSQ